MPAYGYMDIAVPGQSAEENQEFQLIRSRAAQEDISFGKPVCGYLGDENKAWNYKLDTSKLLFSTALTSANSTVITVDGVATTATVYDGVSHKSTVDAIIVKIKAMTFTDDHGDTQYYDCIYDPAVSNNLAILIRAKGATSVSTGVVSSGSAVTITPTYFSDQVFIGISYYTAKDVAFNASAAYAKYFKDQTINIAETGIYWVYVKGNTTVKAEAVAYLNATSGNAALGYFYSVAGDSTNAMFRSEAVAQGSDYLAKLQVIKPVKFNSVYTWA